MKTIGSFGEEPVGRDVASRRPELAPDLREAI
jgi:hypothetical protein